MTSILTAALLLSSRLAVWPVASRIFSSGVVDTEPGAGGGALPLRTRTGQPLDRIEGVVRARKPKRMPVVLTRDEVLPVLEQLDGAPRLVCTLLYGSGLKLLEALRLRVKDLDFGRSEITVRQGKGQKDRLTMLPGDLLQALQDHLRRVRQQHDVDLKNGLGQRRCRTPCAGSTQMPAASGAGSGYSPPLPTTSTEKRASGIGTTCTNP